MANKQPRFSVIVPAFNEEDYLGYTLESLLQQDYSGKYEIIVVDNGSTDSTAKLAKSYDVKVVYEEHPGVCWARQKGAKVAKGEILVSTDADTVFSKNWLSKIDNNFKKTDVIAVTGPCNFIDPPYWGKIYPKILFGSISKLSKFTKAPLYITATNTAFLKSSGCNYNTSLSQGGDELDLLKKLKKQGTVLFDNSNPTFTSSRRLRKGMLYNFFVTFIYYYLLEYNLNRILNINLIGSAPNIREKINNKLQELNNR